MPGMTAGADADTRRDDAVPFTYEQERYYAATPGSAEPGGAAPATDLTRKNVQLAYEITGPFDPAVLEAAVRSFVARHDALRMDVLPGAASAPLRAQRVRPLGADERVVDHQDVAAASERQFARYVSLVQSRDFVAPWAEGGRPFAFRVLRYDAHRHAFLAAFQNLVFDSRALDLFVREVWRDYAALAAGGAVESAAPSFAEAARRQRDRHDPDRLGRALDSWRDRLDHAVRHPWHRPDGAERTESGDVETVLTGDALAALTELGRRAGCTVVQCVVGAFARAVHQHTGRRRLSLWTSMDGRRSVGRGVVGMFAGVAPLKVLDAGAALPDVCAEVGGQLLEALRYQQVGSDELAGIRSGFAAEGRVWSPDVYINIRQIRSEGARVRDDGPLRIDSDAYPLRGITFVDPYALHLRCDEYLDRVRVRLVFDGQRVGRPLAEAIMASLVGALTGGGR